MTKDEAEQKLALTPRDAHNIIVLLRRLKTVSFEEAPMVTLLSTKLAALKGDYDPKEEHVEDSTGSS